MQPALAAGVAERRPRRRRRRGRSSPRSGRISSRKSAQLPPARAERDRVGEAHVRPYGWITTGVPSGSRASACRVCSVACRHPALVGRAERLVRRRASVDREPVASAPARGQPRLVPREHDDAAAEPPLAPGDLVGHVETPGRRRRARGADRDASPEDDTALLAQRQLTLRQVGLDGVSHRAEPDRPLCAGPSRRCRSRARRSPRRTSCRDGRPPGAAAPSRRASSSSRRRASCFREPAGSAPSPSSRRRASGREARGPPGVTCRRYD